jgi:predicted SAM-dependent methyltransferase
MTPFVLDPVEQEKAATRLNVGCGQHPLLYWTNLDADPACPADIHQAVPPLPFTNESLEEIYAGHFLEHLDPSTARVFLQECHRVLVPDGKLGIVVPDTFEVARRYVLGMPDRVEYPAGVWRSVRDLDAVCALFLYSTVQDSPHRWSYDRDTLMRLLVSCGFRVGLEIDRFTDPRIPVGGWYQCGWDAFKWKDR